MDFFEEIVGDRDAKFISYACRWVTEELAKCESEDDFGAFPHVITTKLKEHLVEQDEFFYLSHSDANVSEEEKFVAAKRYEEHVIYACSLTWAMFLRSIDHVLEEEAHEEMENVSPSVCIENE